MLDESSEQHEIEIEVEDAGVCARPDALTVRNVVSFESE